MSYPGKPVKGRSRQATRETEASTGSTTGAAAATARPSARSARGSTRTSTRGIVSHRDPAVTPQLVGFRLFKLTNLLARPFFARIAKEHALTLNEWRVIVVLAAQPGSAAQDVSAATGLHPMNISRALAGLRSSGRVTEARDPDNHRRTLLWLSEQGQATFHEIAPSAEEHGERLLEVLSDEELAALATIVDKLTTRAEEVLAAFG